MKADLITRRFVRCPHGCNHEFSVEHILSYDIGSRFGPWGCDDCGRTWLFVRSLEGLDVSEGKDRTTFGKVILVLPPQKEPIYFTLDCSTRSLADDDREDRLRYLYEEHSCPVNWFRDMVDMQIGNDKDPHGVLKFVRYFDVQEETGAPELGAGE